MEGSSEAARKTLQRRLTVVIVTWNSADTLPGLLATLSADQQGVPSFEVVVVDNASTDHTVAVVRAMAPAATVVQCDRNAGYAAGLNAGVAAAAPSDAVLLLNPDVRLRPGCVARLLVALEETGAGIAVPRMVDERGRLAYSLRREPTLLRAVGEAMLGGWRAGRTPALGEMVLDSAVYDRPGRADWATGAAMLISRECLDRVGPWDESFFLYSEETDFALRARDIGYELRYVPDAVATHLGGDAPISPRLWRILQVNRVRLYARRHGRLRTAAFRAALLANAGFRALAGRATHRAAFSALLRPLMQPGPDGDSGAAVGNEAHGRPPRVLIIVQNLPVPFDRRVWLECQALRDAGYGVSVICPQGPAEARFEELESIRIHRYHPAPAAKGALGFFYEFAYCWLRTALLAFPIVFRDGVSIIQACNPPDTYFALAAPFKLLGKRFVYDQHDLCPEVYRSRFGAEGGWLLGGLLLLEWLTYRVADHVISTNESYRQIALDRGARKPDQVTVVRNGPDPERMRRGTPRPELRAGRDHLCCYLGVMGPQDGVDLVLRAAGVLVHEMGREDVHFALLGFGDSLEELRRLTTELRLDNYVTFTGRADDRMITDYLSTADVALSPDPKDAFNDVSTMNKTMEYMAYRVPVVAFDLRETRVSAGDAAVYAQSNDIGGFAKAVVELLDDHEQRARMGAVGRRRVEQVLAWPYQREKYVEVFNRLAPRG